MLRGKRHFRRSLLCSAVSSLRPLKKRNMSKLDQSNSTTNADLRKECDTRADTDSPSWWKAVIQTYHGLYLVFVVAVSILAVVAFFCSMRGEEISTVGNIGIYEKKLEAAQNSLSLWATVLAVIFVLFSLVGLLEIDRRLKEAKEKVLLIDSTSRKVFDRLASILLMKQTSENVPDPQISFFRSLSRQDVLKDNPIQFYLSIEEAHNHCKAGEYRCAISVLDELVDSKTFADASTFNKAIFFIHRITALFAQAACSRNQKAVAISLLKRVIDDCEEAKKYAWDLRARAFFCLQQGDAFLRISKLRGFEENARIDAEKCFAESQGYYKNPLHIEILLGGYWEELWQSSPKETVSPLDKAITAYTLAKIVLLLNEKEHEQAHGRQNRLRKMLNRRLAKLQRERKNFRKNHPSSTVSNENE